MDLSNPTAVREFLALCLNPSYGDKRTPTTLAKITPGPLSTAIERFAPHLLQLREAVDEAEGQARAARTAYSDALAAWIATGEEPALTAPVAELGQCSQNRVGNFIRLTDPIQLGPHFYQENELGLRCAYCDVPAHWGGESLVAPTVRPYVYNDRSVNRTAKHAVDPVDPRWTLCPKSYVATEPMPPEEAARLPLCGGCRTALTGKTD